MKPLERFPQKEAMRWLAFAKRDLEAAKKLSEPQNRFTALIAFHCQQAAEKALKAFLTFHDEPFRKTHDLDVLAAACVAKDSSLTAELGIVGTLTGYAVEGRYPGEDGKEDLSVKEANDAFQLASKVVAAIANCIERTSSPE